MRPDPLAPATALAALIAFLRERLAAGAPMPAEVTGTVIVAAAARFAPSSYARARLLRQVHACGLLAADGQPAAGSAGQPPRTRGALGVAS